MSNAIKLDNPLTDKRLIIAVTEGFVKILQTMASLQVTCGQAYIEPDTTFKCDVVGTIGMSSESWSGVLYLCFPKKGILRIINSILHESFNEISEEVRDGVGELTNMVYGSTKTALNKLGYQFTMAIPTVFAGDFVVTKGSKGVTLVIPFHLDDQSEILIKIAVQG